MQKNSEKFLFSKMANNPGPNPVYVNMEMTWKRTVKLQVWKLDHWILRYCATVVGKILACQLKSFTYSGVSSVLFNVVFRCAKDWCFLKSSLGRPLYRLIIITLRQTVSLLFPACANWMLSSNTLETALCSVFRSCCMSSKVLLILWSPLVTRLK